MVLFLKIISNLFQEDALDYLDTEKVQELVKNYSGSLSESYSFPSQKDIKSHVNKMT